VAAHVHRRRIRRALGLAATGTVLILPAACSDHSHIRLSASARAAVTARANALIEPAAAAELQPTPDAPGACATEIFGIDPSSATQASQVRTVYAWSDCASVACHRATADGLFPVVVHLDGRPSVRIPSDHDYGGQLRELFPGSLVDLAASAPGDVATLDRRLAARIAAVPSPGSTAGCRVTGGVPILAGD